MSNLYWPLEQEVSKLTQMVTSCHLVNIEVQQHPIAWLWSLNDYDRMTYCTQMTWSPINLWTISESLIAGQILYLVIKLIIYWPIIKKNSWTFSDQLRNVDTSAIVFERRIYSERYGAAREGLMTPNCWWWIESQRYPVGWIALLIWIIWKPSTLYPFFFYYGLGSKGSFQVYEVYKYFWPKRMHKVGSKNCIAIVTSVFKCLLALVHFCRQCSVQIRHLTRGLNFSLRHEMCLRILFTSVSTTIAYQVAATLWSTI